MESGLPNLIKLDDYLIEKYPNDPNRRVKSARIDSGDLARGSKRLRKALDAAGKSYIKLVASNGLDEKKIANMELYEHAHFDSYGVGENLITSASDPVFGGVYKLAAVKDGGRYLPKIKISENVAKITTPCFKEVWRFFDRETDKAIADVITLHEEEIDDEKPYTIFDPNHTWKRKTVENFRAVRLRTQLFKNGECLYQPRALSAVRAHCLAQVNTLWDEVTRFENPHSYYVDLSQKL